MKKLVPLLATAWLGGVVSCAVAGPGLVWGELPPLPDPLGVSGSFAGISGGALLVAGGTQFPRPVWESRKVWSESVYALEKRAGETGWVWSVVGKLPRPLAYGMSVSVGGAVICMGGEDGQSVSDAVFALARDSVRRTLQTEVLPPLPQPCAYGQAALAGDAVFVAGGQSGRGLETALKNFWCLDLSKRGTAGFGWQALPPWPGCERVLASVAADPSDASPRMFVIGGRHLKNGSAEFLKDGYAFSLRDYRAGAGASSWKALPDAPARVAAGPCAVLNKESLVVFGGDDGALFARADELRDAHPGFVKRAFIYDIPAGVWRTGEATPVNQAVTPAVPWGGGVAIPCGEVRPRVRTPRISVVSLQP